MVFRGKKRPSRRMAWLACLTWSGLTHAALVVCLTVVALLAGVGGRAPVVSSIGGPQTIMATWTTQSEVETAQFVAELATPDNGRSRAVDAKDPQLENLIRDQLADQMKESQSADPEALRQRLEKMGQRLESVSSAQAVADVKATLQNTLGLEERASTAEETAPPGDFDHTTGQIDDVRRDELDGKTIYVALMVDAEGRRLEVELDAADGEQLYETFQLMKRFPFMESVYRGLVMGLMDKMLQEEEQPPPPEAPVSPAPLP